MNDSIAGLTPEKKRELLAQLLGQIHPVTFGQRALWLLHRWAPDSAAYNLMFALRISPGLDVIALEYAFEQLIDRHAALRTTYLEHNDEPVQRVHAQYHVHFMVTDALSWDRDLLDRRLAEEADRPFNLEYGPICRVNLFTRPGGEHILLIMLHHIAVDFLSLDIIAAELQELYLAGAAGAVAKLPALNWQYTDFVYWQKEMLAGPEGEKLWQYWQKQLAGELPILNLPTDRPRPVLPTYRGAVREFKLEETVVLQLKKLANKRGMTLYMIIAAVFMALLHRYTTQDDILIGSPLLGRNHPEWESIVGYFANPVVFRGDFSGDPSFIEFMKQMRGVILDAVAHQDYPFPLLVERLQPQRDPSRSPIFQAALFWDRILYHRTVQPPDIGAATARTHSQTPNFEPMIMRQRGAPFDLVLSIIESETSFTGVWQYDMNLFETGTAGRMMEHFQVLLASIADDPQRRVSQLPILSTVEQDRLLLEWNDTGAIYPANLCAHQLFEEKVELNPWSMALVFEDQCLTYHELDCRANQLAHNLAALGIEPEKMVGICLERSLDMVVGLLGILKAGGAYIPLDPIYPDVRLAFMLQDSCAPVLLTQPGLLKKLPAHNSSLKHLISLTHFIYPDIYRETETDLLPNNEKLRFNQSSENIMYTIYTSGSTGQPRGVSILHRSVVNFLAAMVRQPGMTHRDRLFSVTTLSFDIAVLEIFLPLSVGACCVVANRETVSDGFRLLRELGRLNITVMQATPATWQLLLAAGWAGHEKLKILCGGEALSRDLAGRLLDKGSSLWNLYGPTETTIWSTMQKVEQLTGPVSIGRPIANTRIYLLNYYGQLTPIGVPGELYIGGDGAARGYLNQPELTAEKFDQELWNYLDKRDKKDKSFFGGLRGAVFSKKAPLLYKTGDLARYLANGTIEFLGRLDHQVKVRGFRIETAEIETILARHPAVRENVVIAREDDENEKRLTAYIVKNTAVPVSVSQLRDFLKAQLPDYMTPAIYVFLDVLPLTPNGKVDRRALPAPGMNRPELERDFAAPRNRAEQVLANIWGEVLGIDSIGRHDNFFDLGGASIQTIKVANRANKEGLPLTPELIFRYQTIALLSETLAVASLGAGAADVMETEVTDFPPTQNVPFEPIDAAAADAAEVPGEMPGCHTIIESLGVYLPSHAVSTEEVLRGCKKRMLFPLERMTGIKYRRMAGVGEFALDLAMKAISDCLSKSRFNPEDIDLLICCNISRYDGPGQISFEPSTSIKLSKHFGFVNALAFDISNACTGMFTAIAIADIFIKRGQANCALIVSGEYITHLIQTAQKEIESFMDARLACLTVGDAGAALILEKAPTNGVGFQEINLYTVGRYSRLCIAKVTDQPHGGAVMYTDSLKQTSVSIKHAVRHSINTLKQNNWPPGSFQHLIMHQTSETALRDAVRSINRIFGKEVCHDRNTVFNLAERGNTATTTHFVALKDCILNNRVNSGDKVVFAVTGSGQTIGTALYTLDDLPDRLCREEPAVKHPPCSRLKKRSVFQGSTVNRVRIESLGIIPAGVKFKRDAIELARTAAEDCLKKSSYQRSDIGLLVHAGLYRNDFLSEPALAALLAGELRLNDDIDPLAEKKTFAFDVFNGSMGFLNACHIATLSLQTKKFTAAMITAAEIENNADVFPGQLRGLKETGSALILDNQGNSSQGFGNFIFKNHMNFISALISYTGRQEGKTYLQIERDPDIEDYYLECIPEAVRELLESEGLDMAHIKAIFPPQISADFIKKLSRKMNIAEDKFISVNNEAQGSNSDYFTSSLVYALEAGIRQKKVGPGDIGIIIGVGAGIQTGCAAYYF